MKPISKPWYLSKGFVGPLVTAVLFALRSLGIADIDPQTVLGCLYQGAEFGGIIAGMVGRAMATTRLTLVAAPAEAGSRGGGGIGGEPADADLPFVPDNPGAPSAGGER
ncbi:MAG: hypothetical protein U1E38_01715 [Rhodospirillales bacterium]